MGISRVIISRVRQGERGGGPALREGPNLKRPEEAGPDHGCDRRFPAGRSGWARRGWWDPARSL
jgi:hypothetical protein